MRATRRTFLGSLAAPLALPWVRLPAASGPPRQRVVLVVLGGGVRTRDTLRAPANVPRLAALARSGASCTACRAAGPDPRRALRALLTGVREEAPLPPGRPPHPTVFEYARKQAGLPADDVWLVLSGPQPAVELAWSAHPDFGADFAASVLAPDAAVTPELRRIVADLDIGPRAPGPPLVAADGLAALWRAPARGPTLRPRTVAAVERFLLGELARKDALSGDARALRAAREILVGVRPRLLVACLRDAEVAARSLASYLAVLRRNDDLIGALWDAVQEDEELRNTTALMIVPDQGRNRRASPDGSLGQDDNSRDLRTVFLVAAGPGFKRKTRVTSAVQTIDVTPTLCHLLGARAPRARGRVMKAILA